MSFGDTLWPSNYGAPTGIDLPYPTYTNLLATGSKGSWVEVIGDAAITSACHWVDVEITKTNTGATDTSAVIDIGVDPAGGTSYSAVISNILAGHCDDLNSNNGNGTGVRYSFPLAIASGSAVAVRGLNTTGAARSASIGVQLRGGATGTPYSGATCTTHGVSGTGGTSVTPGSDTWGSWTSVGSVTGADYQALVLGVQPPTGTTVNRDTYHFQMGWSSTVKTGITWAHCANSESITMISLPQYVLVPSGTQLQVRAAGSSGGTIDNPRVAIYGISAA